MKKNLLIHFLTFSLSTISMAQETDPSLLSLDRIFTTREFSPAPAPKLQWIDNGSTYVTLEESKTARGQYELVKYEPASKERSVFISAEMLTPQGKNRAITIESFSFSEDGSKILIFTNSSRVWRTNTKGDYWVYDFDTGKLSQLGAGLPASSLMFAKFSSDNQFVAYVHEFNIYMEEFRTGNTEKLTSEGSRDIIHGTFDWVYEEEFGAQDGFRWNPEKHQIAFWKLDASKTGTFYMINNTDSIYPRLIPLQYPKVGQDPSSAQIGILDPQSKDIHYVPIPGAINQNYLPAMQWTNGDMLLIQQLNRKQNRLTVYKYRPGTKELNVVYTETENTWVDINYPDITASNWGKNDLILVDNGSSFLRMTENNGWRQVVKVNIENGEKTWITPASYDVASVYHVANDHLYFMASPENSTQRYLYKIPVDGQGKEERLTPATYAGINRYDIAPNGQFAAHSHTSSDSPGITSLISLPDHQTIQTLVDNQTLKNRLSKLKMPKTEFFQVTTEEGITIDGRMIQPIDFDPSKQYPVLFHVYGEPWGQVATDSWIGMWNIFLAQQGFLIIDMDNRGTPCLKGSEWRKSIYRKIGVINTRDQALAAKEVLKWDFVDPKKTAVWGWSGGGSMTLNLMFQFPEIYKTGMAVAAVSDQLIYDNIYQERYMGIPQENREDFIVGSPVTHAKGLEGNLLIVHGTGDDNVHYQSAELLINELIRVNKQFDLMVYPNRSHGIHEGQNTSRHLYTLLTNYLLKHNK